MNFTNRKKALKQICGMLTAVVVCCTGCGSLPYDMAYQVNYGAGGFRAGAGRETWRAVPFAAKLCVAAGNVPGDTVEISKAEAAGLFSLKDAEVLYAKNIHERLHPASLTKVMTALVALKYGQMNQTLTASDAVNITESGAVLCGLKKGDTMTLDQAMRILLVYSANDAALLIAENIGGSVERFVEMMNEEAALLGATNSHFRNPHGLTESEHYTTVYDLYLIFNAAVKYDLFNEIIHMSAYQTVYYSQNGKEKAFDKPTTNQYLKGRYQAPANVTVIGGKTGTTSAAGSCLVLLSRDENGAPYISVILRSEGPDTLYNEMTNLLGEIHK